MARHTTRKNSSEAKRETIRRREIRKQRTALVAHYASLAN